MTIDFHTHAFPDNLAAAAIEKLSGRSLVAPVYDGTASGLQRAAKAAGIDACVVLGIATNEKQQRNVNDFIAEINKKENLIGFGSVYPDSEDAFDELDRIKNLGLKGIKLHAEYQNFYVDDEKYFPLYRHISKLGLITVFHAGYDIGMPAPFHCTPERLSKALPHFGGSPVVAAHFGGYMFWKEAEEYLAGRDCYFDTSYTYSRIPSPHAFALIKKHGAKRILFGSDAPWSDPAAERRFVEMLFEDEKEREAALGGNAATLLGLI